MKIEEIIGKTSPAEIVKVILDSKDSKYKETLKKLKEEWNVDTHRVVIDKDYLPDKDIKDASGNVVKKKDVNRISVPYQKIIVNRAVAFGFANDVALETNAEEDALLNEIAAAVERILFENKGSSFNRKIARDLYRSKETAEIWYFQKSDTEHENYGFKTSFKIRCMQISPWKDNTLYPTFNEFDNLTAFSREYVLKVDGKDRPTVDVYTDTETRRFIKGESGWAEEQIPDGGGKNLINKIPIIYAQQDQAEWEDVRNNIDRLELLLSKHAEINDYHASPKTFVKGKIKSLPMAGEANPTLQGDIDSDIKILSWQHAPESVKLEIETLIENIHKFTQTADISFKSIKALNQVSGVMLKMLFMDVHLKIMEKNEIWDEYFTRRYNVIKAMLGYLNPKWADEVNKLEISPRVQPFMIDDLKERVETLMTANGNLPLMSHKSSIEELGMSYDVDKELEEIEAASEVQVIKDSSSPVSTDTVPENA